MKSAQMWHGNLLLGRYLARYAAERCPRILDNLERCDFIVSYTQYGNKNIEKDRGMNHSWLIPPLSYSVTIVA